MRKRASTAALAFLFTGVACGGDASAPPAATAPTPSSTATPVPTATVTPEAPDAFSGAKPIRAEWMSAPTRFLASDLLEGRGPASRGDSLAMEYLATEMASYGLQPGGDNGTFFQKVPLVAVLAHPPAKVTAAAVGKGEKLTLSVPDDLVVVSGVQKDKVDLASAPLVFVGYGIVAPEYQWDDYKNVDVRGKVVVVMNNDPSSDPSLFAGTTRLWYGRWDYKYLQAAKKGAAGVVIVHTTPSAGYPYQVVVTSNAHEKFELPDEGEPRVLAKMWATEDASRKLVALGGGDLDALRKSAESRDFQPVPLKATLGFSMTNTVRKVESANVIGVLPGSDPELAKEAVLFTAHHDHLGIGLAKNGDSIYNGAVDNASGCGALLAIARAASISSAVKRTLVFNSVAAEEQGLLGSEWYARHPTFAPGRLAADLNMDSMNVVGKTTDVGVVGMGKSSLDEVVKEVATRQGRTVHGDAFPDRGSYYRSDQFSLAKVGVPGVYVKGGPSFAGHPDSWGKEQVEAYERTKYHQPSDELDPKWDWSGAVQDAELLFLIGRRVADAPALPTWLPNDEFAHVARPR